MTIVQLLADKMIVKKTATLLVILTYGENKTDFRYFIACMEW